VTKQRPQSIDLSDQFSDDLLDELRLGTGDLGAIRDFGIATLSPHTVLFCNKQWLQTSAPRNEDIKAEFYNASPV